MNLGNWFELSLLYGGLLALLFTGFILGSLRYNPEIWYTDYPKQAWPDQ